MKFSEFIKEQYVTTLALARDTVEIFKNPTQSEVGTRYGKEIDYDRGILSKGTLYVWSGERDALHGTVISKSHIDGVCLYIYPKMGKVDISFYEKNDYPKMKDKYTEMVKSSKSLQRFMGSSNFKIGYDHI